MPASFSTLYEIALLPNDTFNDAVATGVIHPRVTRAVILTLRQTQNPSGVADSNLDEIDLGPGSVQRFKVPEQATPEQLIKFMRLVRRLERLGAEFIPSTTSETLPVAEAEGPPLRCDNRPEPVEAANASSTLESTPRPPVRSPENRENGARPVRLDQPAALPQPRSSSIQAKPIGRGDGASSASPRAARDRVDQT
jgi:hypothetical protein